MKFLDLVKIYIRSGSGGSGCVSFRREKYLEHGGPDGGDGGSGGDVLVEAVSGLNTLIDFRYKQHFYAQNGESGKGKQRSGKSGENIILKVPIGTEILCEDQLNLLAEIKEPESCVTLIEGGNGGWGNVQFKSSVNRAPRRANSGQKGETKTIWLRLKLIADAGLIGLPNAGKSTFLSVNSNAKPKIADYPFTTLYPNLGVVNSDGVEMVIADIPGLIKGASQGKGLGVRFLGHVERCSVLIHLLDATSETLIEDYRTVLRELELYGAKLNEKLRVTVLNKIDALDSKTLQDRISILESVEKNVYAISSISGEGTKKVLRKLLTVISDKKLEGSHAKKFNNGEWAP